MALMSDSSSSTIGPILSMPALQRSRSMPPACRTTSSTTALMLSGSMTSSCKTPMPSSFRSCKSWVFLEVAKTLNCVLRLASQPPVCRVRASAFPSPEVQPIMRATFVATSLDARHNRAWHAPVEFVHAPKPIPHAELYIRTCHYTFRHCGISVANTKASPKAFFLALAFTLT